MRKTSYKILSFLLCLALILGLSGCGSKSSAQKQSESTGNVQGKLEQGSFNISIPSSAKGPYEVDRVVDGDTFIAKIGDEKVRIRILCIDTPESVAPEETGKTNTDEGQISSDRAKELLEGQSVYLEYDEEEKDQYDRTLAYVYLADGRMFEEIMISEGLAKVVYYEPNIKHRDELYKVQDQAKKDKAGFWGTGFYK